jgi:hypothetical protein
MASGYTAFISYVLIPTGYTQSIHCNYINRLELNAGDPYVQKINISFPSINDFKFLNSDTGATTGYSAYKIYALLQLVQYSGITDISTVKPDPASWKLYDLTNQIVGYTPGQLISGADMVGVVFEIPLLGYMGTGFTSYTLDYLNYPVTSETDKLCFGDEIYFFGNVTTDIEAIAYTTDISINLKLNEFNSSTNPTWDGLSSVAISEIGIYDSDYNLVAIGKLNDPIIKDSTISRTIEFAIDF